VEKLSKLISSQLEVAIGAEWKCNGRSIKLLDGSTLLLSDTPANQKEFPQQKCQKKGSGFPIARLVALISMGSGAVLDMVIGRYSGKETGEMALARQLLSSMQKQDIVVADRYYCSYFFIAQLQMAGVDLVSRLHGGRGADFRKGRRLANGDHIVELKKPPRPDWMDEKSYAEMPNTITVREVRAKLRRNGYRDKNLVIVTTLLDELSYSVQAIADLYDERWNCELDLRNLKTTMDLEMLRSKSPKMARKELWAALLAYNLIRKMMAQAAFLHATTPRHISFKGALHTFRAFFPKWTTNAKTNERLYMEMIALIAKKKVGNRPGRKEPRKVKRRPKPFPLLQGLRHKTSSNKKENHAAR